MQFRVRKSCIGKPRRVKERAIQTHASHPAVIKLRPVEIGSNESSLLRMDIVKDCVREISFECLDFGQVRLTHRDRREVSVGHVGVFKVALVKDRSSELGVG
jgi:hypothetical protein